MSNIDTSGITKVVDELMQEYQTTVITASGILIAIPLLELSFLSTLSGLSKIEVAVVAAPVLLSAVLFAIAILLIVHSKRGFLGLRVIVALGNSFRNMSDADWERVEKYSGKELREKLRDPLKEMRSELGARIGGKGPLFPKGDWGVRAFTWGIVCLVISLLLLAAILLTR